MEKMIVTPDVSRVLAHAKAHRGSVICYPTETFYALGALYNDLEGLERICKIKSRDRSKGFILLVSDVIMAETIAYMDEVQKAFVSKFWPGPLTVVLEARNELDPMVAPGGRVALRVSSHPMALALAGGLGPITSTSANLSGALPATSPAEILDAQMDVDAVLDGGRTKGGFPSTIVDLTASPLRCIRDGAIPFSLIKDAL